MSSYLLRSVVNPILPWEVDELERARFNRILLIVLCSCLLLSIIIPFLPVDKPERARVTSIPPRLVKMVLQQKKKVQPPPEVIKQPEKEEEKIVEEKPKPPEPEVKKTAKQVAKKHIAVFDALADLRETNDIQAIKQNTSLSNATGKAETVTRNLISSKATQGSGGIKVATASRSSGSGRLAGQNTTNVKSEIADAVVESKVVSQSGTAKRSSENIQLAFDKNKSLIDSLYQRALRSEPGLQGAVNFHLVILASGVVSKCAIVSSDLNSPELEKRLIRQIKKINFGALNVDTWDNNYLINFFPS